MRSVTVYGGISNFKHALSDTFYFWYTLCSGTTLVNTVYFYDTMWR